MVHVVDAIVFGRRRGAAHETKTIVLEILIWVWVLGNGELACVGLHFSDCGDGGVHVMRTNSRLIDVVDIREVQ